MADLEFPDNEADCSNVLSALDRGRSYVQEASIQDINPGHAHYVEGFRALINGDARVALYHFDRALVEFDLRPEVYQPGGLLSKARMHLALAICQTVTEISQVARAAESLASSLKDGVLIPRYLVESILESLALTECGCGS